MADECIVLVTPINQTLMLESILPGPIERTAPLPGDITRASALNTSLVLDAELDLECT